MLSKSLIQFSIDGCGCVPSLFFDLRPNYEVMKIMATSFEKSCAHTATLHSVFPTLHQGSANPRLRWRLLDTHRQVWLSLLWDHCSFLLGSGAYKILFVPSKSLFPQSCVSSVIKSQSILQIYLSVPLFFIFIFHNFGSSLLITLNSFQVDCLFPCHLFGLVGFYCVPSSAACFSVFLVCVVCCVWSLLSTGWKVIVPICGTFPQWVALDQCLVKVS